MNIQNAIKCPDGKLLFSKYRHDYVTHKEYMVDGGLEYFRSSATLGAESLHLDETSSIIDICNKLICERLGILWKDIEDNDKIQDERINILDQWRRAKPMILRDHTMHHAMLHLYVGGYWMVVNARKQRDQAMGFIQPTKPAVPKIASKKPVKKKSS